LILDYPSLDAWDCCLGQAAFPGRKPNRLYYLSSTN